jgi:Phosphorylase superfamily
MKLLLGAFPPELGSLLGHPPAGWIAACTGVGAIASAVNASRLIAEHAPSSVFFIGTCGHYDDRLRIGDLICVRDVIATSMEELRGEAYRPSIENTRWAADFITDLPPHDVAVPPAITRTLAGAALFKGVASAEHLELSGVFASARAASIPVGSALAVANRVGPDAHLEWRANHSSVSEGLISRLLQSGFFEKE